MFAVHLVNSVLTVRLANSILGILYNQQTLFFDDNWQWNRGRKSQHDLVSIDTNQCCFGDDVASALKLDRRLGTILKPSRFRFTGRQSTTPFGKLQNMAGRTIDQHHWLTGSGVFNPVEIAFLNGHRSLSRDPGVQSALLTLDARIADYSQGQDGAIDSPIQNCVMARPALLRANYG